MTNERTIDNIYNNTFEEMDSSIFEIKKKRKLEPAMPNMISVFFQSALICPILTHFEKKNTKSVDLVPNLTHFEIIFQSA